MGSQLLRDHYQTYDHPAKRDGYNSNRHREEKWEECVCLYGGGRGILLLLLPVSSSPHPLFPILQASVEKIDRM